MGVEIVLEAHGVLGRADFYGIERSSQYFRKDVCGDRIHSENQERLCPDATELVQVGQPIAQSKADESDTGGEQDKRTCPQFLVDGKPQMPGAPEPDENDS